MLRRSPCERYLKYLLVHPDRLNDLAIEQRAIDEQVDYLARSYLVRLRKALVPPPLFQPLNKYHGPSQLFLHQQGILPLFFPDNATTEARRLLRTPRAKEFLETMLISGAPAGAIARYVTKHQSVPCSEEGVQAFRRLFWDVEMLDSTEMRTLLRLRAVPPHVRSKDPPYVQQAYATALEKASYKDPRRIAAELPRSQASAIIAQMYMGYMPSEVDIGLLLLETRNTIALRMAEEARGNMPGSADRAMKWGQALDKLREVMEATVSPAAELEKQLHVLRLTTVPSSIPVLHELTNGQHTTDFRPPSAQDEDDGEDKENDDARE